MFLGSIFIITELHFTYGYATLSAGFFFLGLLVESLSFNTLMGPYLKWRLSL